MPGPSDNHPSVRQLPQRHLAPVDDPKPFSALWDFAVWVVTCCALALVTACTFRAVAWLAGL